MNTNNDKTEIDNLPVNDTTEAMPSEVDATIDENAVTVVKRKQNSFITVPDTWDAYVRGERYTVVGGRILGRDLTLLTAEDKKEIISKTYGE